METSRQIEPIRVEHLGDLRAILGYARRFRGDCFVLSIAGEVLVSERLEALLVDLALLQSLGVKLIICFSLPNFAELGEPVSEDQLDEARREIGFLGQRVSAGFHQLGLRCSQCHVVEAIAFGKQAGVDQLRRGRVDSIDEPAIKFLLEGDQVVILPPLGLDFAGEFLWVSPQRVAAAVAQQLQAAKWLELGNRPDLGKLPSVHMRVSEAESFAQQAPAELATLMRLAARACTAGVQRVHLLDGAQEGVVLAEVFSPEGVGHMIHADEYGVIRPLEMEELPALVELLRHHMEDELLLPRSVEELQQLVSDFLVLDLDGVLVGCIALHEYKDDGQRWAELAGLSIKPAHEGRGHGQRLVAEVLRIAQERGLERLFALSTNAREYFEQVLCWQEGAVEDLPQTRQKQLQKSQRNSWVFVCELIQNLKA